jgi:hypothetical protein
MLWWNKQLWLIDHGASLYFHHNWDNWEERAVQPFTLVKDHVLLPWASRLEEVDGVYGPLLKDGRLRDIVSLIPNGWLKKESIFSPDTEDRREAPFGSDDEHRQAYGEFLSRRLAHSSIFVKAANDARQALV